MASTTEGGTPSWGDINRVLLSEKLASAHAVGGWLAVADMAVAEVASTE